MKPTTHHKQGSDAGDQRSPGSSLTSDLRVLTSGLAAWTLMEFMLAIGLFSLLLMMLGVLSVYGLRSFVAIGNYTDLDAKSRIALDLISRDLRQASAVVFVSGTNDVTKWFAVAVTNADGTPVQITYTWDPATRYLTCANTTRSNQVYLTECDSWDFAFYQRTPNTNATLGFFPATNGLGGYDSSTLPLVKLIDMNWKCSRKLLGRKWNTESVQTAQFVLRNKQ